MNNSLKNALIVSISIICFVYFAFRNVYVDEFPEVIIGLVVAAVLILLGVASIISTLQVNLLCPYKLKEIRCNIQYKMVNNRTKYWEKTQRLRFEILWLKAIKEDSMPSGLFGTNLEYHKRLSSRNFRLAGFSGQELQVPNQLEFIENEYLIKRLGEVILRELQSVCGYYNNKGVDEKCLPIPVERLNQFIEIDVNNFESYNKYSIRELQRKLEIFTNKTDHFNNTDF